MTPPTVADLSRAITEELSRPIAPAPSEPGLYRGLSSEDYSAIRAVRHSVLSKFRRTPAHALEEMRRPSLSTRPQALGTAVHTALLEPDAFLQRYALAPKCDRRTKAGKSDWEAFQAAHPRAEPLDEDDWNRVMAIRDSVLRHPVARGLLAESQGISEATIVWRDEETGVLCKVRPDRISNYALTNELTNEVRGSCAIDLKTTHDDASPREWERTVARYSYHSQAAMYLEGANAISPRPRAWVWIVVETAPPYAVAVYEIEQAALVQGQEEFRAALDKYAQCQRTGVWPAYDQSVQIAGLPSWAYTRRD